MRLVETLFFQLSRLFWQLICHFLNCHDQSRSRFLDTWRQGFENVEIKSLDQDIAKNQGNLLILCLLTILDFFDSWDVIFWTVITNQGQDQDFWTRLDKVLNMSRSRVSIKPLLKIETNQDLRALILSRFVDTSFFELSKLFQQLSHHFFEISRLKVSITTMLRQIETSKPRKKWSFFVVGLFVYLHER